MLNVIITIGIIIVITIRSKSILSALFCSNFLFLLSITDIIYWIRLIILELIILKILVLISPVIAEKDAVNNSGIDVAIPAIFPTVLGFKFNVSANFLSSFTKIYFDIATISSENNINFRKF